MRNFFITIFIALILPNAVYAGFSFGLIKAAKKTIDKVDGKIDKTKAATADTQAPTVPTNLTAIAVSSNQINLDWTASTDYFGVTIYKIYRDSGTIPIATSTSTSYNSTGCIAATSYSYTVRACDASNNCSEPSSAASDTTAPPQPAVGGIWVFIPGNTSLGTNDFYVMKYEAKNVSGVATSQADGTPWVNISQTTAITECSALGVGYHLLTIVETQTINRNIEAQSSNWANGVIGSLVSATGGGLKRGNVGITDSASYAGADPEFGTGRNEKAKLVFSNGGEIWDWSGNVREWIYGDGTAGTFGTPGGVAFDTSSGWIEWNSTSPDLSQERQILGPSNSNWASYYGNDFGVGRYAVGDTNPSAPFRSGHFNDGREAGVFSLVVNYDPSGSETGLGFRCGK